MSDENKNFATKPTYTISQDLEGFACSSVLRGEQAKIITQGFYQSNEEKFHEYVEQICNVFNIDSSKTNSFLILIHENKKADVYINNLSVCGKVTIKKNVSAEDPIYNSDFIDVRDIEFSGIEIKSTDKIIWCFRNKFRYGLFFSLKSDRKDINIKDINSIMSACVNYVFFYEELKIFHHEDPLIADGWFPFIYLFGHGLKELAKCYEIENKERRDLFIEKFIEKYGQNEIISMINGWWSVPIFLEKKDIIRSGVEAFFLNNQNGNMWAISMLFPEIEGIIRTLYYQETGCKRTSFNQLKDFVGDKAKNKFDTINSLAFPSGFYQYLDDVVFANFDIGNSEIDISRHSIGHGVASAKSYTRSKAFQAILILDQLHYYLS